MDRQGKIKILEEAFSCATGHSYFECNCGEVFYNSNGGWDWEEGELEGLEKSDAVDLDYAVEDLRFEGNNYCKDCSCWHKRALRIFAFLMVHNRQIVEIFKLVKVVKIMEADDIKTIMEEG